MPSPVITIMLLTMPEKADCASTWGCCGMAIGVLGMGTGLLVKVALGNAVG